MDDTEIPHYNIDDSGWMEDWPDGHVVRVALEPPEQVPPFEYLLVGLKDAQDKYDMATFRMVRAGGSNQADAALRANLFTLVGAITVAGGHIEAEMKRIIFQAEEDSGATFVDVDETWTGLEKRLEAVAADGGPLAGEIVAALAWAKQRGIKAVRDDAVHSAWCLYDVGSVQRSRFRRRATGEIHAGSLHVYSSHVPKMFTYAARLAQIGKWPTAVLPPSPDLKPQPIVTLTVSTALSSTTPNLE